MGIEIGRNEFNTKKWMSISKKDLSQYLKIVHNSSVISQKGEFSEKRIFLTRWYMQVHMRIKG